MNKNSIIKGTIILTIAGFITRLIGFFYRVFLSNLLGAENMGVYQLIFSVYGICFTIYASGIQTSISRLVAAEVGKSNYKNANRILKMGMFYSITTALFLSVFVFFNAEYIAKTILFESRCSSSLKILAILFPFCGLTSCINGYYYGLKKSVIPATTQLFEQIVRVLFVYVIALYIGKGDLVVTCELAVLGVVIGEIASNIYNLISLSFLQKIKHSDNLSIRKKVALKQLLTLSLPLTSNRLLISILSSIEAVLIPSMLRKAGLTVSQSLSIYGILTGMAIPFIMFPTAITNSFAVLLLPTVSEAQALSNDSLIDKTASLSIKFSLIIGILSTGVFIAFGDALGHVIFNNTTAGDYLVVLAWLCPFLYLTTTLGSIINGLGKTHITFFNSIVGILIRIFSVIYLVPKQGISGYLIGLLFSQLIISALDTNAIFKNVRVEFSTLESIIKPSLCMLFAGFLHMQVYQFMVKSTSINNLMLLLSSCFFLSISYIVLLFVTKVMSVRDFQ